MKILISVAVCGCLDQVMTVLKRNVLEKLPGNKEYEY